jgi:hypothetical protein
MSDVLPPYDENLIATLERLAIEQLTADAIYQTECDAHLQTREQREPPR